MTDRTPRDDTETPESGDPDGVPAPRRAAPRPASPVRPMLTAAVVTAAWAALVSFLPVLLLVLLAWLVDGRAGSAATALRFAGAGWLLANGVPVDAAGAGRIGLVPLAVTALAGWRLVRAGAHTARAVGRLRRIALPGAAALAVAYGLLAAGVAVACSGHGLTLSPLWAVGMAGGLALACGAAGAVHETGMGRHIWGQLSPAARYGLRGGVFAAFGVFAAGALAAGAALALHADEAADTLRSYHAGVAGEIGIVLLCAVYAPTLAVWAVSYLAGPGFAVGVGTSVGIAGVRLGPVPAVPVLAGLPGGASPVVGSLLLAVPPAIGVLTGILIARRQVGTGLRPVLGATALTGLVAGALAGVAVFAASGPLGGGRLAEVGPSWWQVGLAVAGLVGVPAVLAAAAARGLAVTAPRR